LRERLVAGLVAATAVVLAVAADSRPARGLGPTGVEARAPEFAFRTPGDAAYCGWSYEANGDSWTCVTPNDGFFVRFLRTSTQHPRPEKGYDARFKGLRDHSVRLLPFGRTFYSSDAEVMVCDSRATGLTCEHYSGLSLWLGRGRAYRIFLQEPGRKPHVHPLLRTGDGIRCGIQLDTLEPANPVLTCWNPADGTSVYIPYDDAGRGADYHLDRHARRYRPSGFPLLRRGATITWRCRSVTFHFADRCSRTRGTPAFTCTNGSRGVTCVNRRGRGFTISRVSFYVF
jgi:hypothetical protein